MIFFQFVDNFNIHHVNYYYDSNNANIHHVNYYYDSNNANNQASNHSSI